MSQRQHQRGFSLLIVVVLTGVVTVASMFTLNMLGMDKKYQGYERQARQAREAAEGGLAEVRNDQRFLELLPTGSNGELTAQFQAGSDSLFHHENEYGRFKYDAEVRLTRISPIAESSKGLVRAVVYELEVDANQDELSASRVEAEIYKIASSKTGIVQPQMHAR